MINKNSEKKTCNYCIKCGFNYSNDIQYCPHCFEKLFPVPYTTFDTFNKKHNQNKKNISL